jgi:N-acetylglucosaminyldiphosphoundecaprenol N-acetyl-beta-D-mannosaminyltransferase
MSSFILSTQITPTSYTQAVHLIAGWAKQQKSRCVYAANVHMLMEAYDSPKFQEVVNSADLVTPDGMPLVWALRRKGYKNQQRVYGPTLMLEILAAAAKEGIPVGFLGSSEDILQKLTQNMIARFPGLIVGFQNSPPFRPLNTDEDLLLIQKINGSGIKILFVGLGCPKQEYWIASQREKTQVVMMGVGAAFAFHAGVVRQAPAWMQRSGLEWLFRLTQEPSRLWKRYAYTNPRFAFLIVLELLLEKITNKQNKEF